MSFEITNPLLLFSFIFITTFAIAFFLSDNQTSARKAMKKGIIVGIIVLIISLVFLITN